MPAKPEIRSSKFEIRNKSEIRNKELKNWLLRISLRPVNNLDDCKYRDRIETGEPRMNTDKHGLGRHELHEFSRKGVDHRERRERRDGHRLESTGQGVSGRFKVPPC